MMSILREGRLRFSWWLAAVSLVVSSPVIDGTRLVASEPAKLHVIVDVTSAVPGESGMRLETSSDVVIVCCQEKAQAEQWRRYWEQRGVLGKRAFVIHADASRIPLADGLADVVEWRGDKAVIEAIGEDDPAQTPRKGFSTTSYAKANEHGVYFAGPQRRKLVAVSARS